MEMFIIAVVAVAAFAAVLYPLLRGRGGTADDGAEFDEPAAPAAARPTRRGPDAAGPEADPVTGEGVIPPMAAGPVTPVAPGGTTAPPPFDAGSGSGDPVEAEVARYRAALRAGTICRKCGEANPPESRFCAECGAALPLGEANEFE